MAKMSFSDRVKQKAKESEFQGGSDTVKLKDGMSFFKMKKGRNEIMVIPFEMTTKNLDGIAAGDLWYRFPIKKHFNIGAEDKAVICPTTIGKKCPICEYRAQLMAKGHDKNDDEVKALDAKKRELYYIIDVNSDEDAVQVLDISYFLFGRKLEEEINASADDNELVAGFAEPESGAVLAVRMSEKQLTGNKFLEAARFDFEERTKQQAKLAQKAASEVPPLSDLVVVKSYDELKKLFFDLDAVDQDAPKEEGKADTRWDEKEDIFEDAPVLGSEDGGKEDAPKRPAKKPVEDEAEEEPVPPKRKRDAGNDEEIEETPKRRRPPKDEEPEEEAPRQASRKKQDKAENECPGKGVFGQDCDTLDGFCEECVKWDKCRDLTDEYEKSKRKK